MSLVVVLGIVTFVLVVDEASPPLSSKRKEEQEALSKESLQVSVAQILRASKVKFY